MPDPSTLSERLRALAETFYGDHPGGTAAEQAAHATLREAAAELERLTRRVEDLEHPPRRITDAMLQEPSLRWPMPEPYLPVRVFESFAETVLGVHRREGEDADAFLERVGDVLEADASTRLRRFLVRWYDFDAPTGQTPAPGSFVRVGPAAALYRVHAFDPAAAGDTAQGYVATLEPVDAHEVPVAARVTELPLPVSELTAEPVDAEVYCGATYYVDGDADGGPTVVCKLRDGHADPPERSPHWGEVDGHGVEWHETVVRP